MGSLFSPPSINVPTPPPVPPAAQPATIANPQVAMAGSAQNKALAAGAAISNGTLATSAQGAVAPTTAQNTLLGGTK